MAAFRTYPGETFLERYPDPGPSAPLAAAVYPNRYMTGMSNLGFHFLFSGLSRSGKTRVERLFLDKPLPNEKPATIYFTVSYEEDLINAVKILLSMGIEPLRSERNEGPLIIAGGPVLSSNPLPFFPLADVIAAGEGEGLLPRIMEAAHGGACRIEDLRERLAGVPGIILPGFVEKDGSAGPVAPDDFQRSVVIAEDAAFPRMMLVEISRGCPGSCRFCMATTIYRPFRTLPLRDFESAVDSAIASGGAALGGVGLISTAAAAHPDFSSMLRYVAGRGLRVGLSSLRAEDLDGEKSDAIGKAGIISTSLAPESGSERVRRGLGKKVPDERYFEAARMLSAAGVRHISLYMLVGSPLENDATRDETRDFLSAFASSAGAAQVTVRINVLVPKPRTPIQFMAVQNRARIEEAVAGLSDACRSAGVRVSVKGLRSSFNQARIALGGEAVGRAAVKFARGGTSWKRALRDEGIDPDFIHSDRTGEAELPWEAVFGKEDRKALLARYRAMTG